MTKRRFLIIVLSIVAIAITVPVVPWVIVEWHVREIGSDRQALMEALEAPQGSWEWRAVEEYARTLVGEETLRREYAWLLLREPWGLQRNPTPKRLLAAVSAEDETARRWELAVRPRDDPYGIVGRSYVDDEVAFVVYPATAIRWMSLEDFENRPRWVSIVKRLTEIVKQSSNPVATSTDRSIWVLRAGGPIFPPKVRLEEFVDPETLVVFWKIRDSGRDEGGTSMGSE